jgi:hypothetical protein
MFVSQLRSLPQSFSGDAFLAALSTCFFRCRFSLAVIDQPFATNSESRIVASEELAVQWQAIFVHDFFSSTVDFHVQLNAD